MYTRKLGHDIDGRTKPESGALPVLVTGHSFVPVLPIKSQKHFYSSQNQKNEKFVKGSKHLLLNFLEFWHESLYIGEFYS